GWIRTRPGPVGPASKHRSVLVSNASSPIQSCGSAPGARPSPGYPGEETVTGIPVGCGSDPMSYRRRPAMLNWMFWISSSSVPSPSTSGAANAEHHGSHSSGPNEAPAAPPPATPQRGASDVSGLRRHPGGPVDAGGEHAGNARDVAHGETEPDVLACRSYVGGRGDRLEGRRDAAVGAGA